MALQLYQQIGSFSLACVQVNQLLAKRCIAFLEVPRKGVVVQALGDDSEDSSIRRAIHNGYQQV